jgi:hypothetical protein
MTLISILVRLTTEQGSASDCSPSSHVLKSIARDHLFIQSTLIRVVRTLEPTRAMSAMGHNRTCPRRLGAL